MFLYLLKNHSGSKKQLYSNNSLILIRLLVGGFWPWLWVDGFEDPGDVLCSYGYTFPIIVYYNVLRNKVFRYSSMTI